MPKFDVMDSWTEEVFRIPHWPTFEYDYDFDRRRPGDVFESILVWLERNEGTVQMVQVPNAILVTQGRHTLFGWSKNARKYLLFELKETAFGAHVHVIASPTLSGVTDVRSMMRETHETWAFLLEELWQSMGDAKSASRVADIRLRRDSAKDRGRERANRMIVILPVVMVSVLIATFLMWLLSTRTSATYLETPQVFSMTILLILWQLMTYAVVKRVAGDEKLDEQR